MGVGGLGMPGYGMMPPMGAPGAYPPVGGYGPGYAPGYPPVYPQPY